MSRWSTVALLPILVLHPSIAHADEPKDAGNTRVEGPVAQPTLVPPAIVSDPLVPYPEGAEGDATIVLLLTIGVDGTVRFVTADPNEPFSIRAIEAAKTWIFTPATRDGAPVAAKIRFEVSFRAPKPVEAPPPIVVAPVVPTVAPKPAENEESVRVRGVRQETSASVTLSRAEVRQLPGAFGDPFRALDALPGVTPIVSGLPFFYVRGAPPGNVGYFIDGIRVPYLFHVGAGPSVIHPGLVENVSLFPGGYPARFGRFSGGIVSADMAAPKTEFHGEANLRLFDAGALAETGFADGKGSILLGGRYSYTAAMLSLLQSDATLGYRDYQARITYNLTPKDRLSFVSFGSYDLVSQTVNNIENVLFASEFYRGELRYDRAFSERTRMRIATTLGFEQTRIPGQPRNSKSTMGNLRVEFSHAPSDNVRFRAGGDLLLEGYRADTRPYSDPDDPDTGRFNALFPERNDFTVGAWTDVTFKGKGWEVTPGLRLDHYRSGGVSAIGFDPRIASRLRVSNRVSVLHSFGVAHQAPSFVVPIPGLAIGQLRGGLQRSLQASAGVEVELPSEITATVTAFDNIFQNMSDTLGVSQTRAVDNNLIEARSLGSALGLEFYLRKKLTSRIGGYVSYTFSRSTRSVGSERFYSSFDRPH
ncbi:MAG: TonB-dependent receptor plug domain-containing protein, partial [Polyangiaceae bacterium]|nr:TonB-dependent receptor plug domain-containing protein [Polyangiaceae bacterium]